jgi:DNA modification methylase
MKRKIHDWPTSAVQMRNLHEIIPYPNNPRLHPPEQIALLAKLMTQYGVDQPIVVDEQGVIIKGHGRLLAAVEAGFKKFPVVVHHGLGDEDKRAIRLADNQSALLSSWDNDLLRIEIRDLQSADFDLDMLGFPEFQLIKFGAETADIEALDEPIEPPAEVFVQRGDLWLLGEHRLLCGDCTIATDVAKALSEHKPHLMVTDPPYGVDYDPDWRNRADRANGKPYGARAIGVVQNDKRNDWCDAWALFNGDVIYAWHPPGAMQVNHYEALIATGFKVRMQIIWAKQQFPIGRGDYHVQHEPCWYAVREGRRSHWSGDRTQSTLWEINKPIKSETGHSTQKPIECMRRPMLNNSQSGDYVYDPFVGSGTTIVAAELTGRRCIAIEIQPAYVQISIERWQKLTGKQAKREDGQTLNDLKSAS